jgi:TatD DNase family protein
MNLPGPDDYIDIHTHEGRPSEGIFALENFMAHQKRIPEDKSLMPFTYGIHPWFLNKDNYLETIDSVMEYVADIRLIAVGEAGFDKLRGPSMELQRDVFEKQVSISEKAGKPMVIHCVKSWDELFSSHKKLGPLMPWLIHGFRGSIELADQLISKGFYFSFWFDFVIRPESAELLRSLPQNRIFLETDGADIDIKDIYQKVAGDLIITVEELKSLIQANFKNFFHV